MRIRFFQQLKVLLWKNYKLKTRRPILFFIELVIPLVLCIILGEVRKTKPPTVMTSSYHYATGLPSAGLIPFLQGLPVVGCWDYERYNVEYYPLPDWFKELPNIEKAFRKVTAWPLVYNTTDENRKKFKDFAMTNMGLTDREATALTVSTVNLTSGLPFDQLVNGLSPGDPGMDSASILFSLMDSDIESIFGMLLTTKACNGNLEDMLSFPQQVPYKLSHEEMQHINNKICTLDDTQDQETTFKSYTRPNKEEIQKEVKILSGLLTTSFYPIPIGASAPVLDIYQKALHLNYRAVRTSLAVIKYYICPTLKSDMEKFFVNLDHDISALVEKKKEHPTTPPLYEYEDPEEQEKSPQQPHRRSANANIFNRDRNEVENNNLTASEDFRKSGKDTERGNQDHFINNVRLRFTRHILSQEEKKNLNSDHVYNEVRKSLEAGADEISIIESEIWYTLTQGRIFYSPQTPLVEKIVEEANSTFRVMGEILNRAANLNKKLKTVIEKLDDPTQKAVIMIGVKAILGFLGLPEPQNVTSYLTDTSNTLSEVSKLPNYFSLDRWTGFQTERELELAGIDAETSNTTWLWAGVTFEDMADNRTELPDNIRYKIRMNSGYMPPLQDTRYTYWRSYPYDFLWDRQYWVYGFVYIQDMVESGIIRFLGNGTFDMPGAYTQMFPYPCWLNDKYLFIISRTLPMVLVISWVYIVAMSTKRIVYEKELRLKEVMTVMGLKDGVHWWGWALTLLATSSITNLFLCIILKYGEITIFTDVTLLYLLLSFFSLCNIATCFLISVFFTQSKLAAVVSAVAFYSMYLPYTIASLQEENMDFWMKMTASISSTTAFGFGMLQIARYEEQGIGLQWDNFALPPDNAQQFSTLHVFGMMALDFCTYILLTLYFQKVLPSKHGSSSKPWYFPLSWCCSPIASWFRLRRPQHAYMQVPLLDDMELDNFDTDAELGPVEIEPAAKHLLPGVEMVALSKHYGGKHNPYALRDLTLTLYQGQVTALLGHNGAGKTTTMSIITGMIAPTSGNYDIRTASEIKAGKDTIGVCPQHNILWEELTIAEHLLFYGQLRGMEYGLINKEMEQFMRDVDLPLEKRDCQVSVLSGGMKRKLSVAIAFLGNTKTLVLDEPTAGVDPKARRDIWDMIVNNKRDRTILLSTHHMEEADVLGDRIAILSQGHLICCGSSLFLKRLSGGTYFLTVEINAGTNSDTIVSAVEEMFRSVLVRSVAAHQVVMELEAADMDLFQQLCVCLDDMKKANEIESYGISAPSMEEVFLKLSANAHLQKEGGWEEEVQLSSVGRLDRLDSIPEEMSTINQNTAAGITNSDQIEINNNLSYRQMPNTGHKSSQVPLVVGEEDPSNYNQGYRLYWQQIKALFVKRWHHGKRDKKGVFAQVVLPALFIAAAMSINLAVPMNATYTPRVLSFAMFSYPNYIPFESRTPAKGAVPFNQNLLKEYGVTYGDKFSRNIQAEREKKFEMSETYPSKLVKDHGRWKLQRMFVPKYRICDFSYKMNNRPGETDPFPTPGFVTESGDIFTNVTGNNLTNYLLITQPEYKLARYTAFTFDDYRKDIIPEYTSEYTATRNIAKTWYLNKGYHAMPTAANAMNNLQLKNLGSKHHITVAAQAMNDTAARTSHEYIMQGVPIVISIFIIVGLSFVPTSFVVYLVGERSSNAKHLQFCAGVSAEVYWVSNYLWDMFNFLLPTLVSIVVFFAFQQEAFVNEIDAVVMLILLYGLAATPMFYPASFIFSIPSAAYVTLLCTNLFVAVTTSYSVFTLEQFPDDPTLTLYARVLDQVFLIFPPYCLGKGFVDLTYRWTMTVIYESMGIPTSGKLTRSVWDWKCLGRYMVVLPATAIFWLIVTVIIEKYLSRKRRVIRTLDKGEPNSNEDVQREEERARIATNDILNVNGLTKRYKSYSVEHAIDYIRRKPTAKYSHLAVKNITFGVRKGECFGLLGINGAGKTSTFNMLTGALGVTAGDASVGGHSVVTSLNKVQQLLGYCPQFDALINSLTGREMLTLFASIHGVNDPAAAASSYIKQLNIEMYADMQCYKYSGGNRRKLSAAIALVGNPDILLLDEPTAGMDPGARRQLWEVIRVAKNSGTSVLLTSHSMGECEVLCDRIGIMTRGSLQCVGTPHHLKQKYGSGYSATIKTSNVGGLIERLESEDVASTYTLLEQHHNMVIYSIPQHAKLAPLFAVLAALRQEGLIEDYSVSQCSLEDVFINFARKALDLGDDADNLKAQLSPSYCHNNSSRNAR